MKKVSIKKKSGGIGWCAEFADPTEWIADCVQKNKWGKPERWVLHKDELGAEAYDDADVLEEKIEEVTHSVVAGDGESSALVTSQKWVKLKAEYTVEIEDITNEYNLQQVIMKRKAEYPTPEEFMNAFFDGGDEAIAALQAKRIEIKSKYPKP